MCFSLERRHENCVFEGEIHEGKESKSPGRTGFYFLSLGVASALTRSISPVKFLIVSSLDPVTSFSKSPLCFKPYCVLWEASNIEECVNLQPTAGKEGSEAAHSPSDAARGVWNTFKRLPPTKSFRTNMGALLGGQDLMSQLRDCPLEGGGLGVLSEHGRTLPEGDQPRL